MSALRLSLLLIGLTSTLGVRAQQHMIEWDAERPLSWSDFQAAPDPGSGHAAGTYRGVKYIYSYTMPERRFTFEVTAYFDPARSWRKPDARSAYLLRHEQLHFDISELHARLLRKAFAQATFSDRFEAEITALHAQNSEARREMQRRYDSETQHSNDRGAQGRWETLIRQRLQALQAYRRP
ncbi:MAG: DUF922 domain-containing protein [Saprospiraceae bacterium]|nr:DUF922 domain-containing protein [Saprospiraceae bacterium]